MIVVNLVLRNTFRAKKAFDTFISSEDIEHILAQLHVSRDEEYSLYRLLN